MKKIVLSLTVTIIMCIFPYDGELDKTFGNNGILSINFGSTDAAYTSLVQPDNKLVTSGKSGSSFAISRTTELGILDSTFSSDGKATSRAKTGTTTTNFSGTSSDYIYAIAIQSNNKIVAVGYSNAPGNNDFALAQYNSDGSLDTSFGTSGKTTTSFGGADDQANATAAQSDGKIIAVGFSNASGNYDFALARYSSDGSLDTSFGTAGKTTTNFSGVSTDKAHATAIQSDGKIIAVGYSNSPGNNDFALTRYSSDGSLDTSFNITGKVTTSFGGADDQANATAIQSDGKIIAVGYSDASGNDDFALARYNSDGSLDTAFGTGGKTTTNFSGTSIDVANAIAIQTDGKIIAAGYSNLAGNFSFALARYNSNGSLDTSFGTSGKTTTDFGGVFDVGRAIAIQSDGKIIVSGFSNASGSYDFALARYNSDGSLDTTFGTNGKITTNLGGTDDKAYTVNIQSDGKILVTGNSNASGNNNFALAQYNSDGSLDTAFGDYASANEIYASILLRNGSIILAGYTDTYFALVGYLYDGSLDTSFGSNGITTTDFGGTDKAYAIAEQQEGLLIVAGVSDSNFALARYNNAGVLDSTFGSSGLVTTDFGGTDQANAVVIQDDKKIIAIGTSDSNFALARYAKNGSLDSTFGSNGTTTTNIGGTDQANAALLLPNGKIVVAGHSDNNFALAQYKTNGSLDTTFGNNGIVTTNLGGSDVIRAIALQPDGKILAAGYSGNNFAIARYKSNGGLDSTFGSNGIVYTDIGGTDQIWSINVQPDAKIFAAGDNGTNFVLARYLVPSIKVSSLARDLRAKYFLLQR